MVESHVLVKELFKVTVSQRRLTEIFTKGWFCKMVLLAIDNLQAGINEYSECLDRLTINISLYVLLNEVQKVVVETWFRKEALLFEGKKNRRQDLR